MGRHYLDVLNKSELKKMVGAFQAELDQSESTIAALRDALRMTRDALHGLMTERGGWECPHGARWDQKCHEGKRCGLHPVRSAITAANALLEGK